ncbi:MAG: DUF2341 domain-containing protein [Candidatus Aenigmarchaeota archaeon]|nr:DUF2341 domain-containing protein [Candidatus Aenigmarchaeota archaeon]
MVTKWAFFGILVLVAVCSMPLIVWGQVCGDGSGSDCSTNCSNRVYVCDADSSCSTYQVMNQETIACSDSTWADSQFDPSSSTNWDNTGSCLVGRIPNYFYGWAMEDDYDDTGTLRLFSTNDMDGDLYTQHCSCLKGTGFWALGGELASSYCCGDDIDEHKITSTAGTGMDLSLLDSTACCDRSTDCTYEDVCTGRDSDSDADGDDDEDVCTYSTTKTDTFDTKNTSFWTFDDSFQTVPFDLSGENVLKMWGNGTSYKTVYQTTPDITDGEEVYLEFQRTATSSWHIAALEPSDSSLRWCLQEDNSGNIRVQYYDGVGWYNPKTLISGAETGVWYGAILGVDGGNAYMKVWKLSNPSVYGEYSHRMHPGVTWRFRAWQYQTTVGYIDNFQIRTSSVWKDCAIDAHCKMGQYCSSNNCASVANPESVPDAKTDQPLNSELGEVNVSLSGTLPTGYSYLLSEIYPYPRNLTFTTSSSYAHTSLEDNLNYCYRSRVQDKLNGYDHHSDWDYGSLSSGLVGHWIFEEGTGTTVHDQSGNSRTGTAVGSPTWQSNTIAGDYCMDFDGTDSYVQVTDASSLRLTGTDFSIEFFAKLNETPSVWRGVLFKTDYAGGWMVYHDGSRMALRIYQAASTSDEVNILNSELNLNGWNHVAYTYKSSTKELKAYLNGKYLRGGTYQNTTVGSYTGNLFMGSSGTTANSQNFPGNLDDVRIYTRILSETEIEASAMEGQWRNGASMSATVCDSTPDRTGPSTSNLTAEGDNTNNLVQLNWTWSDDEIMPDADNNGLVGRWDFEEGIGLIAKDNSGNGYDGNLTNGPAWISGVHGDFALDFDGVNKYVDLGNPSSFPNGTSARTMCAWAKTNTVSSNYRWVFAYGSASVSQAMFIGLNGATLYGGGYGDDVTFSNFWEINVWKHVCLVYDGTYASLYGNGVLLSGPTAKTWSLIKSKAYVGRQINDAEYWNGTIDDIRIYNRTLSADEIRNLMLVGQWHFDEGAGFNIADASGSKNNAAFLNVTTYTPDSSGYIKDWLIVGPFDNYARDGNYNDVYDNTGGNDAGDSVCTVRDIDALGGEATVTPYSGAGPYTGCSAIGGNNTCSTTNVYWAKQNDADTYIDFDGIYAVNQYVFAYGFAYVYAPTARIAQARFGSDDGIQVWVNGDKVHQGYYARGSIADSNIETVTLRSGWNRVMVKVDEGWGGWGFHFRFTYPNGTAMTDLKISLDRPEPTWNSTGMFGGAMTFDGVDDYQAIDSTAGKFLDSFTIEAMIKTTDTSGRDTIVGRNTAAGGNVMILCTYSGKLDAFNGTADIDSQISVADGNWHHVALRYNLSNKEVALYLDGEKVKSDMNGMVAFSATDKVSIGQEWDTTTPSDFFQGELDEVRIWSRALSDAEIQGRSKYGLFRTNVSGGNYTPVSGFWDDFETDLSGWTIYSTSSTSVNRTTSSKYLSGSKSVEVYQTVDDGDTYILKNFSIEGNYRVEGYFYDNTSLTGTIVARPADGDATAAMMGVATGTSSTNYVYRISSTWYVSGVSRSTGWHKFTWISDGSSTKGYMDDIFVNEWTDVQSLQYFYYGSWWAVSGPGFYFDDLTVTPLVLDNNLSDTDGNDSSAPDTQAAPNVTAHSSSQLNVSWSSVSDNGNSYYYYIESYDSEGNVKGMGDVAIFSSTSGTNWMPVSEKNDVRDYLLSNLDMGAVAYDYDEQDDLIDWMDARMTDSHPDILLVLDMGPEQVYNCETDGSKMEEWYENGNIIIWTGDWSFYGRINATGDEVNGCTEGINYISDNALDIISSSDTTTRTSSGATYTPSMNSSYLTHRPVGLTDTAKASEVEVFAYQNVTWRDSALYKAKGTAGYGYFFQYGMVYDTSLPRKEVLEEFIENFLEGNIWTNIVNATVITGMHSTGPYYVNETTDHTNATDYGWGTATSYQDIDLAPNTQYCYAVTARDNALNVASYSSETCKYTLANIPTNLSAIGLNPTQIFVQWNANGNPAGTYYNLSRNNTSVYEDTGTGTTDSYLTCNTQYTYKVMAKNGDGVYTANTSEVSAYTLPEDPVLNSTTHNVSEVTMNNLINFTATTSTPGCASHFHYLWDTNPRSVVSSSDAQWDGLETQLNATWDGNWYLHAISHNGDHVQSIGGTIHLGPFIVNTTPIELNFVEPTHPDQYNTQENYAEINTTILYKANIDALKFNWNGTNYTIYDEDLILGLNFNNVSEIGENDSLAVDVSHYRNDGTIYGANYTEGKYNLGLQFDGTGDYVDCGNDSSLGPTGNLTLMSWLYLSSLPSDYKGIIEGQQPYYRYLLYISASNRPEIFVQTDAGAYYTDEVGHTETLNLGWNHIVGVYNGTDLAVYLNGGLSYNRSASGSILADGGGLRIGRYDATGHFFNGTIDEVRIYNRSLNSSEIWLLYQSELAKYEPDKYRFYANLTDLVNGTYTYYAWGNDTAGNQDFTDGAMYRTLYVGAVSKFSVYLNAPANDTNTSNNMPDFNFTVNGSKLTYSCTLFVNESSYGMNASVQNNTPTIITADDFLPDGLLEWYINCTSAGIVNLSEIRQITVDNTTPVTTASAVNNDSTPYTFNTWTSSNYVNVTLNCNDGSGFGCDTTMFCTDTTNTCTPVWLYGSWSYRTPISISNTAENLTDYQVRIDLNSSNVGLGFNWTEDMNATRFTYYNSTSGTETECSYWIESWNATTQNATIWVKVPFLEKDTSTTVYMYYNNSGVSTTSSADSTFLLFDDFNDASLDTDKWQSYSCGAGSVSETGGYLRLVQGGSNSARPYLRSKNEISYDDLIIEYKGMLEDGDGSNAGQVGSLLHWDGLGGGTYCVPNNGFRIYMDEAITTFRMSRDIGASETDLDYYGYYANTSWHDYSFSYFDDDLEGKIDGSSLITASDSTSFSNRYVGFLGREAQSSSRIDDVRVRKYASPEPSSSVGSEESPSNIHISDEGVSYIRFRSNDTLGNVESIKNETIRIDTIAPVLNFTDPTEDNATIINRNWTEANISIEEPNPDNFVFNWNGTNHTFDADAGNGSITYSGDNEDLVLALNFNEGTGNTTEDFSNYGNNGTFKGTGEPAWTTDGRFGSALKFDGVDDYVVVGEDKLDNSSQGTAEAWIKLEGLTAASYKILGYGGDADNSGVFGLEIRNTGGNCYFGFVDREGPATDLDITRGSTVLTTEVWYHVVWWSNGTVWRLYVNGKEETLTDINGDGKNDGDWFADVNTVGSPSYTSIGAVFWDRAWLDFINGTIDDVRIYNRSLTAEEIMLHYESSLQKYSDTQWQFYSNITGLTEGTYTYYGWANDTLGSGAYTINYTETSPRYLYVDMTAPTLLLLTLNDTSPVAAGNVTFTLDFSEAMNETVNPTVKIKNSSEYTITALGWFNSTRWVGWYNFTTGTGDGNYTINVTAAEDLAGNTMEEDTSNSFILDTTAPTVQIVSPENTTYGITSVDLNYTATDSGSGISACWYSLDGEANQTLTDCANTTLSDLSDGEHNLTVWANDTAGNLGFDTVYFNVSTLDLYLSKSFVPDLLVSYEVENLNVTTTLKINKSSTEVSFFNFTDEVPWDFSLDQSSIRLVLKKYSPYSETNVTENVTIDIIDLPGENNTRIEINCSNTSACFGSYLSENDSLVLTYLMNSSALEPDSSRSTITTGNISSPDGSHANRTLNTTITCAEVVLRGYKDLTVDLANPQNISARIVVTSIGGTVGNILFSDYLPEGSTIYDLQVYWYNGTYNALTESDDYNVTVDSVTLPGNYDGEVYIYNFTVAGVTWPGQLGNNESIIINYSFWVLGGGQWDLPTIISAYDPIYNRTVKTEMYANANVPSFDVILEILTKKVEPGELAKGLLRIINVGGPRAKVDVYSNYAIKTFEGRTINEKSETLAVVEQKEKLLELEVPESTESGKYVFESYVSYVGREALSTETFEVIGEEKPGFLKEYGLYILIGLLVAINLVVLMRKK